MSIIIIIFVGTKYVRSHCFQNEGYNEWLIPLFSSNQKIYIFIYKSQFSIQYRIRYLYIYLYEFKIKSHHIETSYITSILLCCKLTLQIYTFLLMQVEYFLALLLFSRKESGSVLFFNLYIFGFLFSLKVFHVRSFQILKRRKNLDQILHSQTIYIFNEFMI